MKIAVAVHGRFFAFDLVRSLLSRGHDVTLFTNYPKWAVERFGIPKKHVRSCWQHGVATRVFAVANRIFGVPYPDSLIHTWYGRWAASQLHPGDFDVVYLFSGIAEESLGRLEQSTTLRVLVRASSHILTQDQLLTDEECRTGIKVGRPSSWMIQREQREYAASDQITVLSTFAYNSFMSHGCESSKIHTLLLGADPKSFRPSAETIRERVERILSEQRLRILYIGALSLRKGIFDFREIVRRCGNKRMEFRFVGPVEREARSMVASMRGAAQFSGKVPQSELASCYSWADVFVFPTIEDGFPVVLAQAQAHGLPVLTTSNCCGPDMVQQDVTGWILRPRDAAAFVERLRWCDSHREKLATMTQQVYESNRPRRWDEVAQDFEQICRRGTEVKVNSKVFQVPERSCNRYPNSRPLAPKRA